MRVVLSILLILVEFNTHAQTSSLGWAASIHYGTTLAHNSKIAAIKSNNPIALQFDFYKQKINQKNYDICSCYPQSGVTLSINDYGNSNVLGQGIHLNYYVEPQFKISKNNYFLFRATAGFAFMNSPYDAVENPNNFAYSLPVSGFVSLGPGWKYFITDRTSLFFIIPFNHVSNGGIKDPNLGLNFPSVQFGISQQKIAIARNFKKSENIELNKSNRFYLSAFASSRTVQNGEKKRFLIYGIEASYVRKLAQLISFNSAIEFYKDDALQERYRRETGSTEQRYRAGTMAGIQFDLGKIELYHRLGIYIYDPGLYNGLVFHRHGIQYLFNNKISAGVEVKAHKEVANFLDFRLKYNIN